MSIFRYRYRSIILSLARTCGQQEKKEFQIFNYLSIYIYLSIYLSIY